MRHHLLNRIMKTRELENLSYNNAHNCFIVVNTCIVSFSILELLTYFLYMGQVNINNSVTLLIVKMITVNDSLIVSSVGQNSSRNRKWTNMISVAGSYVTFSLHLFSTVVILRKRCIKCFLCWLCLNKIPEWWECWSIISLNQFIHISVRPRKNSILQFCIMSELWWDSARDETFQDALLLWNEVNAGMPFENEPIHAQTQGRERGADIIKIARWCKIHQLLLLCWVVWW